jgi:single-strand DNA-binding protein
MLKKGIRVYVEGRLQTRSWQGQDGSQKQTTEIVISDMIILDSKRSSETDEVGVPDDFPHEEAEVQNEKPEAKEDKSPEESSSSETDVNEDDIPF